MSMANLQNTPRLEKAIELVFQVFHNYSGNKNTLSRSELNGMLTTELGDSRNAQEKEAVDKVMVDLDSNKSGEVDFNTFIVLLADLLLARNN